MQLLRKPLHPGVRQLLRQHGIAGPRDGAEGRGHRVLGARGQGQLLGPGRQSQPAEPRRHRLAMAEMPRRPDIAEQLRPGQDATLEESRFEHRDLPVRHQDVHREVDHAVIA